MSAAGFFLHGDTDVRADRLLRENVALAAELDELRVRFGELTTMLDELKQRDRTYRSLAGLDSASAARANAPAQAPRTAGGSMAVGEARASFGNVPPEVADAAAAGDMAEALSRDLGRLVHRAERLVDYWEETVATMRPADSLAATPSILPVEGYLTRSFGDRSWHPLLGRYTVHDGIDLSAPAGTPVVAPGRARVGGVEEHPFFGLVVELDHGNGYATRYAHLSRAHVRRGEVVERGARIGDVGESGFAAGPHLHYEVRVRGQPRDPLYYILDRSIGDEALSAEADGERLERGGPLPLLGRPIAPLDEDAGLPGGPGS